MGNDKMVKRKHLGDPNGRRLAKARAGHLAEAERVCRMLEILLENAGYPNSDVSQLVRELAAAQRVELQKAYGHIEPRTRFKSSSGQPLLRNLPISHLYVDESGTANPGSNPNDAGIFAMGAIAIGEEAADEYIQRADAVKNEFFGRSEFQFHEPFMRKRRTTSGVDYGFAWDANRQQEFDDAVFQLIDNTEFVTFGVAIRKQDFLRDFVDAGIDPYLPTNVYSLAITLLLERYVDALAHTKPLMMGRVHFESQGPKEDAHHQLEYARLLIHGTQWVSASAFQANVETGLRFSPKRGSNPNELADMFARDLFEWVQGGCQDKPKWWDLFCSKVYVRGSGEMGTFGIKVFPDGDIRDRIEAHRVECGATPWK